MLVSSYRYKILYFALFAFAVSVEYGFQSALGRFTLPTDVENTLFASDTSNKIGAITLFFSWLAVLPVALCRLLFLFGEQKIKHAARLFAANVAFIFAAFSFTIYAAHAPFISNSFAAHLNNWISSGWFYAEKSRSAAPRESVSPLPASIQKPKNNIVFIVDESVRADHLSVNGYARDTTPRLRALKQKGLLQTWGAAVSGATESVGSNRLLLSGVYKLPDANGDVDRLPSLFQYAKAAGYRTFYFDGQKYSQWNGTKYDRADFGEIVGIKDFPDAKMRDIDGRFGKKIRELIENSSGNFIWVNKRGVHFRYEENYPSAEKVWAPVDSEGGRSAEADNQALINNYDNAVRYNSETFFGNLFPGGETIENTIYIYTSDHGQTLVQGASTHSGKTRNEALVPVMMIGQTAILKMTDPDFRAAHANLFATALDLMEYPENLRRYPYSISLLKARKTDSSPRSYFSGYLSGDFGGELLAFDE